MSGPGGLFDTIFGVQGENAPSSLISPDMLARMRKNTLINAGIGLFGAASEPGATFGGSLAKGLNIGQDSYQNQLQSAEQQGILAQKQQEEERIRQLRQTIANKYAPVAGETVPQKIQRITAMASEYANGGDSETAQRLINVANSLRLANNGDKPRYFQQNGRITKVDPDGTITTLMDDGSLEARLEIQKANLALRQQGIEQSGQRIGLRVAQNFYSRNRKIIDWGHALNQAIATISDAKGNKYLTSSSIANFVQAADQNARLQIQMLNFFKSNIDPSFKGQWEQFKSRALTGQYTPQVYEKLLEHLRNLQALATREYESQRSGEIRQRPELENSILPAEDMFGGDETERPDSTSTGGNPLDRF